MRDTVMTLSSPPITRHQLALYMAGSGDLNPLHVDSDVARAVGFDDVIAHGMLIAAMAARMVAQGCGMPNIRALEFRFLSPTRVQDSLEFCGEPAPEADAATGTRAIKFSATTADGRVTLSGFAIIDDDARADGQ